MLSTRGIPVEVHGGGRFVIPARDFAPAYLRTYEEGRLKAKVEEAIEALRSCTLCPRDCEVNRLENRFAVCKVGRYARVASFFHHFGEEDVLRGWAGSGTIFFSWCNLRCVFCLHPDAHILTDRGMQRIEDLFTSGEHEVAMNGGKVRYVRGIGLRTRQGRLAPVSKAFMHPYRGELVVLKPYGLPSLLLTPEHMIFAAARVNGVVQKMPAGKVTKSHFLIVPKPRSTESRMILDVKPLLQPFVGTFRGSKRRKVPVSVLGELGPRLTSTEIGRRLGYHPAYVRTLLSKLRRGRLQPDSEFVKNSLVQNGERVRFKTEKGNGIPCRVPVNADLASLLGYYCAEGHVTAQKDRPNSHSLIFSFSPREGDLAKRTSAVIERLFNKTPALRQRRTTLAVEVRSASVALLFESLCGAKSRGKRVPWVLFDAPVDVVRAFLASYFEGDGSRQPPYIAINTVSRDLALGIVALLLRVGIFPYFYATPREATQLIEGRTVRQSTTLYYVKCRLEAWDGLPSSKRLRYVETPEAFYVPIRGILRVPYEGPVYNIEVADRDHSYTANGVAVGNCQNFETSQIGEGDEVSPQDLARMMLRLQEDGCHNINFVTPEHVVPQILEALLLAVEGGLRLPLVYNTGAYDSLHSIQLMDGVVDVYMPDFKLWDRERSRRYLLAPNYPDAARGVIRAMHEQVGELKVNEDGLAVRGVLVRHLVMPGMLEDTREIMQYLGALSPDTYVNVMDQYYPAYRAKTEEKFRDINRRISRRELDEAFVHAKAAGLWRFDRRWRQMAMTARIWA